MEIILSLEVFNQLAFHLKESVKSVNVFLYVMLGEVGLVRLDAEMLVNFLLFEREEPPNLLDARVLYEGLGVLQLSSVLGVVAH